MSHHYLQAYMFSYARCSLVTPTMWIGSETVVKCVVCLGVCDLVTHAAPTLRWCNARHARHAVHWCSDDGLLEIILYVCVSEEERCMRKYFRS